MGVASHLHIRLEEYDARIRTFVPHYEEMLAAAAHAVATLDRDAPEVVDLGSGTGALAHEILRTRPDARVIAVDEDTGMLDVARQRLAAAGAQAQVVHAAFAGYTLPACDAVAASLALHHVRTKEEKRALYRRCRSAIRPGGLLVSADCCPASDPRLAAEGHRAWRAHLRRAYSDDEADQFLAAWAIEDVYFGLADELAMLRDAGFAPDVVWRAGAMAVIAAR